LTGTRCQVEVAEHRGLLFLVSTHATYITYRLVERLVTPQAPAIFSAASSAVAGYQEWEHENKGLEQRGR
jgi:hypothetical protein